MNGLLHVRSLPPVSVSAQTTSINRQKLIFLQHMQAIEQRDHVLVIHMASSKSFPICYRDATEAKMQLYDILKQHKKNDGFILESVEETNNSTEIKD